MKAETDSNDAMEIKTEADSNDILECSLDSKPNTGMFVHYVRCVLYCPHSYVCVHDLIFA